MASNYQSEIEIPLNYQQVVNYLSSIPTRLSQYRFDSVWQQQDGSVLVCLSTGVSFTTWGNTIKVSVYPHPNGAACLVRIRSESTLPTQIIDFGKNKSLVQGIEQDLKLLLR